MIEPRTDGEDAALSAFYYYVISSAAATAVIEEDCLPILHNPACTVLLGYGASELTALVVPDLVPAEFTDHAGAALSRVRASPDTAESFSLDLIGKHRRRIPVRMTLTMATVASRDFVLAVAIPA